MLASPNRRNSCPWLPILVFDEKCILKTGERKICLNVNETSTIGKYICMAKILRATHAQKGGVK